MEALADKPGNSRASPSTDKPPKAKAKAEPKPKASPKKEAKPEEPKPKASPKKEAKPEEPKPKASPKKEAKPEEPKTKTKPVKKDIPHKKPIEQKGNTPLIYSDLQEYLNNMKGTGVIKEQLALRKMPGLTPDQRNKVQVRKYQLSKIL